MGKGGKNFGSPGRPAAHAQLQTATAGVVPSKVVAAVAGDAAVNDFYWSATDEPHASRRKLILEKYPEIKQLYGHCPYFRYQVLFLMTLQMSLAYIFRNQFFSANVDTNNEDNRRYSHWLFFAVMYVIGGTANHALLLAYHELSHNLGFKKMIHNKLFAIVANIPTVIPTAISLKRYHMDHHKYQGVDGIDVDIPTRWEGFAFQNSFTKFFFVLFQVCFYALRPGFVNMKQPGKWEFYNIAVVLIADVLIAYFWGVSSLLYLLLSDFFGAGFHPVAGHFIAEHYVFPGTEQQETYSYYGPLNKVMFNVGYHNEHHDFPYVPGSRLPEVRRIAAEFYEPLESHMSYVWVIYQYIVNPQINAFARVKRSATGPDDGGVVADDHDLDKSKDA